MGHLHYLAGASAGVVADSSTFSVLTFVLNGT